MITNPAIIKTIIIVMLLLIVGSLFSGLMYMFKSKGQDDRMVKALTVRIALSMALFLLLMAGFYFGIIPTHRF
ncbi:MAG TPA: twin transmembrane helix small protein [Acidiferrobacteraceae bacterium]|nr:twin transmembrane helix small protein [Acidiferrobacteraceae bacterium]